MTQQKGFAVLSAFIAGVFLTTGTLSATLKVSNMTTGDQAGEPWSTIQDAIDATNGNATFVVYDDAGTTADLVDTGGITIASKNGIVVMKSPAHTGTIAIQGDGSSGSYPVDISGTSKMNKVIGFSITNGDHNVYLRGGGGNHILSNLIIKATGAGGSYASGIRNNMSTNVIAHNTIQDNNGYGVWLHWDMGANAKAFIMSNIITGNADIAIGGYNSGGHTIVSNYIDASGQEALQIGGSSGHNWTILNNYFATAEGKAWVISCTNHVFAGNFIGQLTGGTIQTIYGDSLETSYFSNNVFATSGRIFDLKKSTGILIEHNTFTNSTQVLWLTNSTNIYFFENNCSNITTLYQDDGGNESVVLGTNHFGARWYSAGDASAFTDPSVWLVAWGGVNDDWDVPQSISEGGGSVTIATSYLAEEMIISWSGYTPPADFSHFNLFYDYAGAGGGAYADYDGTNVGAIVAAASNVGVTSFTDEVRIQPTQYYDVSVVDTNGNESWYTRGTFGVGPMYYTNIKTFFLADNSYSNNITIDNVSNVAIIVSNLLAPYTTWERMTNINLNYSANPGGVTNIVFTLPANSTNSILYIYTYLGDGTSVTNTTNFYSSSGSIFVDNSRVIRDTAIAFSYISSNVSFISVSNIDTGGAPIIYETGVTGAGDTNTASDTGLTAGTTYNYVITYTVAGVADVTTTNTYTTFTGTVAAARTNESFTAGTYSTGIAYSSVTNMSVSYENTVTGASTAYTNFTVVQDGTLSFEATNLPPDTVYTLAVSFVDYNGNAVTSNMSFVSMSSLSSNLL